MTRPRQRYFGIEEEPRYTHPPRGRLIKRYPQTLRVLLVLTVAGLLAGVSTLWAPAVWLMIGVFWLALIIAAVLEDRSKP